MHDLLQDPMFFYGVAFVIFVALAFVYGRKPALGWIDAEIAKIRSELDQARSLRAEAEAALAASQIRQAEAEAEAKIIVTQAQAQVAAMKAQAERDLTASLARHNQMAAERIRLAEQETIADVRAAAVDMAMSLARKGLSEKMTAADSARLMDAAITDLPAVGGKKAKAA